MIKRVHRRPVLCSPRKETRSLFRSTRVRYDVQTFCFTSMVLYLWAFVQSRYQSLNPFWYMYHMGFLKKDSRDERDWMFQTKELSKIRQGSCDVLITFTSNPLYGIVPCKLSSFACPLHSNIHDTDFTILGRWIQGSAPHKTSQPDLSGWCVANRKTQPNTHVKENRRRQ